MEEHGDVDDLMEDTAHVLISMGVLSVGRGHGNLQQLHHVCFP